MCIHAWKACSSMPYTSPHEVDEHERQRREPEEDEARREQRVRGGRRQQRHLCSAHAVRVPYTERLPMCIRARAACSSSSAVPGRAGTCHTHEGMHMYMCMLLCIHMHGVHARSQQRHQVELARGGLQLGCTCVHAHVYTCTCEGHAPGRAGTRRPAARMHMCTCTRVYMHM